MADKKKDRRRSNRQDPADRQAQRAVSGSLAREYNYVLRVSSVDKALLKKYQEPLLFGTAGFAEVYYNYLFDNPDIADVLYTYERGAGMSAHWCVPNCRLFLTVSMPMRM
jgi:hypothetical protein